MVGQAGFSGKGDTPGTSVPPTLVSYAPAKSLASSGNHKEVICLTPQSLQILPGVETWWGSGESHPPNSPLPSPIENLRAG